MRREPRQGRSRQTVHAVLGAVSRVIRREGVDAVTTNRIAEAAGVSIGSLYQYFPDKKAIFSALHERHVEDVRRVIERTMAGRSKSLDGFTRTLVEGLADLHAAEPELHELVSEQVPEGPLGFRRALRATFERVTSSERMLFVLPNVIEALVHGISQRPSPISAASAREEAVRTVLACLESCRNA
ncbi:TetR/AcrR family transcriptional regulator [Pendulispora brunnea]|uniref:TetR/AcrR family transcriptional regulator n=1 Tax=Pendulispora brunnea TaxID=2905690 RepID=A0ABZ2JYA9_9BACT